MSEKLSATGEYEAPPPHIHIETGMFTGTGEIIRDKWMVRILVPRREICYWTIPCTADMTQDIERVQREICQAIEQFSWDPMSMS